MNVNFGILQLLRLYLGRPPAPKFSLKIKMFFVALDFDQQELQSVEIVGQLTHFYTRTLYCLKAVFLFLKKKELKALDVFKNPFNYGR